MIADTLGFNRYFHRIDFAVDGSGKRNLPIQSAFSPLLKHLLIFFIRTHVVFCQPHPQDEQQKEQSNRRIPKVQVRYSFIRNVKI